MSESDADDACRARQRPTAAKERTTPWGFACCVRSAWERAAAGIPVQRLSIVFAHPTQPDLPPQGPMLATLKDACSLAVPPMGALA